MSTITIEGWKEVENDGDFIFVPPETDGYYWNVDRWWHQGRTIYESCARIDINDDQIYIDGTTPAMKITVEYTDDKLIFTDYQDIRRVLVCKELHAVTRQQTTEFIDIDFEPRNGYVVRSNNYPIEVFDPRVKERSPYIVSASVPVYPGKIVNGNSGKFTGGNPAEDDLFRERIRLQGRKTPTDPFQNFSSPWQDLEVRGDIVPVTFTVFEDIPIGGEVRILHQLRLIGQNADGSSETISAASTTYTVAEELRLMQASQWLSSGRDFKVGNTIQITPAVFSNGTFKAVLEQFSLSTVSWKEATESNVTSYYLDREVPTISYAISEPGFYRLRSTATLGNQTVDNFSGTRRAY
tara:strand:+ start:679 stop:1734 length:1056 start_codon:yes stop_codon:yes gene_type:complete